MPDVIKKSHFTFLASSTKWNHSKNFIAFENMSFHFYSWQNGIGGKSQIRQEKQVLRGLGISGMSTRARVPLVVSARQHGCTVGRLCFLNVRFGALTLNVVYTQSFKCKQYVGSRTHLHHLFLSSLSHTVTPITSVQRLLTVTATKQGLTTSHISLHYITHYSYPVCTAYTNVKNIFLFL